MGKTRLDKEICVTTKNEVGALTKLSSHLSEAKINVWALSVWVEGNEAKYRLITDNNNKAIELCNNAGCQTTTRDVVVTELEDKPGTIWNATHLISDAGIDIEHMYLTTCGGCPNTRVILCTSDNNKALSLLG